MNDMDALCRMRGEIATRFASTEGIVCLYVAQQYFPGNAEEKNRFVNEFLLNKYIPTIARVDIFLDLISSVASVEDLKVLKNSLHRLLKIRNEALHAQLMIRKDNNLDLMDAKTREPINLDDQLQEVQKLQIDIKKLVLKYDNTIAELSIFRR